MSQLSRSEKLFRETVREILRSGEISRSPVLRRTMMGEASISDWDLARSYARGSRMLLTESQRIRGKILVESLWNGLVNAASWIGEKISGAKKLAGDTLDAAGRVLTELLNRIPGGQAAFEMLKEFSSEIADQVGGMIQDALNKFSAFIMNQKGEILKNVFESGPALEKTITSIAEDAASKVKEGAEKIKEFASAVTSDPGRAVSMLFDARSVLGEVCKIIIDAILTKSKDARKRVENFIMSMDFFREKPGMLVMRLVVLLTTDMGGEAVLKAASNVWKSVKGLEKPGVVLDHMGREFRAALPEMIKGLVSGDGAVEQIIRTSMGDPTAAANLIKNAIKMCFRALKNRVEKGIGEVLKGLNIKDPVGKMVTAAVSQLVGAAAGVTESLRRRLRETGVSPRPTSLIDAAEREVSSNS